MKSKLLTLFLFLSYVLNSQTNEGRILISIGGNTDILPISFTQNFNVQNLNCLDFKVYPTKNFNFSLSLMRMEFKSQTTNYYEKFSNYLFNLGFIPYHKNNQRIEIFGGFGGQEFNKFFSNKNITFNLGGNFYPCDFTYIGTGLRLAKNTESKLSMNSSVFTWYWQLGFYFNIYKK